MAKYFGVIGDRDYIKIKGERVRFWHFLDEQPSGWLSSLVYKRKELRQELAGHAMLWDCGAWSYRSKDEPDYTPEECADLYREYAAPGSMVIAPDHMLIPGVDIARRRAINIRNAEKFLRVVDSAHVPMATVHGENLDERVTTALNLRSMGYTHLAMGGLAAQAARKGMATDIVRTVREAVPDVHLHVLGLSSPEYSRLWAEIGVQTFDGSSHFKKAFTAGVFYTHDGNGKLVSHQAARPGNAECAGIVAPECNCKACTTLRAEGVDTRTYGSNENNMGRAAHNQNMLMRAQRAVMQRRIVLVACCGKKLPHAAPARDIYQSELFRKSRIYAEQHGDSWMILSAKHGLINPDAVIEPYDETLNNKTSSERRAWSEKVAAQLAPYANDTLTVLAGEAYCGWVDRFKNASRPMQGLGIGQQLAWLLTNTKQQADLF